MRVLTPHTTRRCSHIVGQKIVNRHYCEIRSSKRTGSSACPGSRRPDLFCFVVVAAVVVAGIAVVDSGSLLRLFQSRFESAFCSNGQRFQTSSVHSHDHAVRTSFRKSSGANASKLSSPGNVLIAADSWSDGDGPGRVRPAAPLASPVSGSSDPAIE